MAINRTETSIILTGDPNNEDESHNCDAMGCLQEHVLYRLSLNDVPKIEQAVLESAAKNDDCLMDLLQIAIEEMNEEQSSHLLDKVHQVQSENLRDIREWKEDVE